MRCIKLGLWMTATWVFLVSAALADQRDLNERQNQLNTAHERVSPAVVSITDGLGSGTGVVVSADGIVLTASHVIDTSRRFRRQHKAIKVIFPDGESATCKPLGMNRYCDAAVLKIIPRRPDQTFPAR